MKKIIKSMSVVSLALIMKKSYSSVLIFALGLITYLSSCSKQDLGPDFGDFGCLGCGTQDTTSIIIYYGFFTPDTLVVKEGTTVTWRNFDNYTHNVMFRNDTSINSGNITNSGNFRYTIKNIGTFRYDCSIHPESAILIVTP